MLAIAYYILKVILCSGILFGYYRIALHNKIFHRWNRFFLLSALIVSLIFPLIKINIWHNPAENDGQIIKLLNVVTTGDEYVYEVSRSGSYSINGEQLAMFGYILVSILLLVLLLHALLQLSRMVRQNPSQKIQQINVVQTDAKGTPFSFFRYIFWNRNIDMHSDAGIKIFTHEMVHVAEKHSADRLFINITLIFFWINPFFWLIRREMNMIHEFIADSKAIEDNDTAAFAAMILHAAYPNQTFGLTSSFFTSSIKRRLHMLSKMKNPRMNYISRLLALPLLTFIFVAFTVKTKQLMPNQNDAQIIKLETPVTVVIDAGHGGDDGGAVSKNGIREKDITLSLSKKIKALNKNKDVKIILSRDRDITQSVRDKVDFAVQQKPDLFISLHVGWENAKKNEKNTSGFEIYLSRNQTAYTKPAQLFGSLLAQEIESTYGKMPQMKQRAGKGLWVLDAPSVNYPSLLIECGYMSNKDDLAFITSNEKQEKIARDILTAIERFAVTKEKDTRLPDTLPSSPPSLMVSNSTTSNTHSNILVSKNIGANSDTLPEKIKSVDVTNDDHVIIIYKDDKAEKITKAEAKARGIVLPPVKSTIGLKGENDSVLYFLNEVEIPKKDMEKIIPSEIESITVLKDKRAMEKYGRRAEHGVIEIQLKKRNTTPIVQSSEKIFQIVEKDAQFPGGDAAWSKYISQALSMVIDSLQAENKTGTCVVQFIVDMQGNLSDVKPLTMEGTLFARTVTNAIKNGPKWIPAMQNGHKVTAYRRQPVTFQIANE